MRYPIVLSILFEILNARRVTATRLAQKHGISTRTVYRYVDALSPYLPLHVRRGRAGGIFLSDSFRLPVDFFTSEEYAALRDALRIAYAQTPDRRYLSVAKKLAQTEKNGAAAPPVCIDGADVFFLPQKGEEAFAERFRLIGNALREKRLVRILYEGREFAVEPHALVVQGGKWSLYAFCHTARDFRYLPLDEIRGVSLTDEPFRPRPCTPFATE